jgi:hypothetical protein
MRPFRSRAMTAIVFAILILGLFGTVANAAEIPGRPSCFPEDPWRGLSNRFPEDPWGMIAP